MPPMQPTLNAPRNDGNAQQVARGGFGSTPSPGHLLPTDPPRYTNLDGVALSRSKFPGQVRELKFPGQVRDCS